MAYIKKFGDYFSVSEDLKYHIDREMSILDSIFRPGSNKFFSLMQEARRLYLSGDFSPAAQDSFLFEQTDFGEFAQVDGNLVPLDLPMVNEEAKYDGREVKLNQPMRNTGPGKKYKVYVKNPKTGKINVVYFGDLKGGLTAKINDPEARKNFVSRHQCETKHKDKTKPGYWSCNLPRYAKYLGLAGGGNFYW